MFASKGIAEHLMRGLIGIGAFVYAAILASSHPWLSLALIPVALVALRGCPTCWMMGLIETVFARAQGKATDGLCADGHCAVEPKDDHLVSNKRR